MVPKPSKLGAIAPKKAPIHQLPVLRFKVRSSQTVQNHPCVTVMSAVLGCYASSGHIDPQCMNLEQKLRACMDSSAPAKPVRNSINYELTRFYKSFRGATKQRQK